ncbi:MAG: M16 family metallopeptidase [Bacteroidota bacterium]
MRYAVTAALAAILVATVAHATPPNERIVLPNGFVIIAVQDDSSAVSAFHLAVRVNPASIAADRAGILALSQQVAQHNMRDLYQQDQWRALGEDIDATRSVLTLNTEVDFAEVRCQVAPQALGPALQLAGKALFDPAQCTPEQVAAAKDVLSNAVADSAENVVENTYYRFLRAFYGNQSPLARSVQGTPESLMSLSAGDVSAFRSTFIGPNNASLCIIGPQSPQELIQLAKGAFGTYPRSKTGTAKQPTPALPTESLISVATIEKWQGSSVMVGVGTPPYGTDGFLQAQLIYTLLEGKNGRLLQDEEIRNNLGLNHLLGRENMQSGITVLAPMAMPRPFLVMHMLTIPRLMEPAREAMLGHLLAFTMRPPEADELSQGKRRLINAYAMMQTSRLNLAKSVNCYEIYGQDYTRVFAAQKDIEAIQGQDLVKLAKSCFGTHAVGLIMPGDADGQ